MPLMNRASDRSAPGRPGPARAARAGVAVSLIALALALALAIACSAASPGSVGSLGAAPPAGKPLSRSELAGYQGADRQEVLEAGARAERKLTWYTSLAGPIVERLLAGYRERYPFVETEAFRAAENELLTKATEEASAGRQAFDVVETPPAATRLMWSANLLTRYHSPALAQVPDALKAGASDNTVESATVRVSYVGFGYNTTLIPEGAVPRTLDDLLAPGLTGKLALAGSTTGVRWVGAVLERMGDEPGRQFLARLARQQRPVVHQVSGKALLDLIAKGEVAASPTIFRDHVLQLEAEQNAPVRWVPLEPVIGNAGQGGLAAKAPHPHAALLFLDYLLGEGQQVLAENYYSTGATPTPFVPWIPERDRTAEQIEQDAERWGQLFHGTFRSR